MFALFSNGCTNKRAAIPNLNLVKLRQDIEGWGVCSHGQSTKAAHLILDYIPISSNFQALKFQIKARDLPLHLINIAVSSFLNPGPRPQGVLKVKPLLPCKAEDEVTPSQPTTREEEEEEEEEMVEVPNS